MPEKPVSIVVMGHEYFNPVIIDSIWDVATDEEKEQLLRERELFIQDRS